MAGGLLLSGSREPHAPQQPEVDEVTRLAPAASAIVLMARQQLFGTGLGLVVLDDKNVLADRKEEDHGSSREVKMEMENLMGRKETTSCCRCCGDGVPAGSITPTLLLGVQQQQEKGPHSCSQLPRCVARQGQRKSPWLSAARHRPS